MTIFRVTESIIGADRKENYYFRDYESAMDFVARNDYCDMPRAVNCSERKAKGLLSITDCKLDFPEVI